MLLVVDVGNTQTHFGIFEADRRRALALRHRAESTADELGAALRNLLELRGMRLDEIDASIVSSTVPELAPEWVEMARRYLGHEMPVVGPGIRRGCRSAWTTRASSAPTGWSTRSPRTRASAAACIVVDFGTAITYDAVSADGRVPRGDHLAGRRDLARRAYERAAKLPKIDLGEPRSLIGKTTVDAIRSGVVYGFAASVDGIVARLRGELGAGVKTIATGGLARAIVPFTVSIDRVDDLLTLERAAPDPRAQR